MSENRSQPAVLPGEAPVHSDDERTWAALAHASVVLNLAVGLGGIIGACAVWLTRRQESEWVGFHGLQSLLFQGLQMAAVLIIVGGSWILGFAFSFLTLGLGTVVAVPLMLITFFVGILIMVGGTGYALYGAYQIYEGRDFRYLWIGDWLARRSSLARVDGRAAASGQSQERTTRVVLIVAAIMIGFCVFGALLACVFIGLLGGLVYLTVSSSAWVGPLWV